MSSSSSLITCLLMTCCFSFLLGHEFLTPSTSNVLNGKHLRIIWTKWEGNPKGLSGPLKGGVIVDYLSARLNFTYEMVRVTENRLEPEGEHRRGLFSYLWDQQADLVIHSIWQSDQRMKVVDLTVPWVYDTLGFLIPVTTKDVANTNAVLKPFQWLVWLLLLVSIASVILVLYQLQKKQPKKESNLTNDKNEVHRQKNITNSYLYVFGNLLSQGGPCTSRQLKFRVVAGVWTLSAFVLVQAYTSILFTFIVAPNPSSPLINSIYDVVENDDIQFLVKKGGTMDNVIHSNVTQQTTLYKKLRDRVESFPQARCELVSECINLITPGSKNVFVDGKIYQLDAIQDNFKKTGKCDLQLARDGYLTIQVTFALEKNSPFTKTINQGILELLESGLIDYWDLWFRPTSKCMEKNPKNRKMPATHGKHIPLSLKNLTGAFIILAVGLTLSFLAFLYEKIRNSLLDPYCGQTVRNKSENNSTFIK